MRACAGLIALLSLSAAMLPSLDAQDAKGDPKNAEEKKADDKKTEPKAKPVVRVGELVVLQARRIPAKVKDIKLDDMNKELVIITADDKKSAEFADWNQKALKHALSPGNDQFQRKQDYERDYVKRFDDTLSGDIRIVSITDTLRVRTEAPPAKYDAAGNSKKLSNAELAKLRGVTQLPGYTADLAAIKPGQVVFVYLAKSAAPPPSKQPAAKKGGFVVDPNLDVGSAPALKLDAYMILIHREP